MKACVNYIDKGTIGKTRKYTTINKMKQETTQIKYSPVVIGGSTVI